jgi:hypothetical protein
MLLIFRNKKFLLSFLTNGRRMVNWVGEKNVNVLIKKPLISGF